MQLEYKKNISEQSISFYFWVQSLKTIREGCLCFYFFSDNNKIHAMIIWKTFPVGIQNLNAK